MKRTLPVVTAVALAIASLAPRPLRAQTIPFGFNNVGGNAYYQGPAGLTTVNFFTLALGANFTSGQGAPGVTYNFTAQLTNVQPGQTYAASPILSGSFTTDATGRFGATYTSGLFTPIVDDQGHYQVVFLLVNNSSSIDGFGTLTLGNSLAVSAAPEPASLALLATGLSGLSGVGLGIRRRRGLSKSR